MRRLARKVRDDIAEYRANMTDIRQEEKTIPHFTITAQHCPGSVIKINSITIIKDNSPVEKEINIDLRRGDHMLISGPNGIGKSTMLRAMLAGEGVNIGENVRVGYYSQDFSELDYDSTAFSALREVALPDKKDQDIYAAAGRFLLRGSLLQNKVASLSEGQKGLLCYARFMLQEPGLLIMDEPTNHINFRHIPVIADALQNYAGVLIVVSHVPDFVSKLKN
ncbi:MAG: putative ABC transporter ATP-binding protein [candidate division WS6 bacterium OLB21]|uniref:Putative ABC transporter ATP-binding protein n=1 Tax=candidate division WS6 bacterium OLB21 TaxID=1617427 RepID=A0A136KJD7_9BACT|nr:MAG: putative ABC transporter ATP-binding protein [candidate division WS6 bacterium OLB21]